MATPEFIVQLRKKIGHDLLWLPGVCGVVLSPDARSVLLVKRADDGRWTNVSGILDPGEAPADGIRREIVEETGVQVRVDRMIRVAADHPKTFDNGDQAQFLTVDFRCTWLSGEAHVGDDESSEVRWFGIDSLPELDAPSRRKIRAALPLTGAAEF